MKFLQMVTSTSTLAMALAILLSIGLVSFRSTVILVQDSEAVHHSQESLTLSTTLLSGITDAETGQRGYLITGDDTFLRPYQESRSTVEVTLREWRLLHQNDPSQLQEIDALEKLVHLRLSRLNATLDLRIREGFEAARQATLTGDGKKIHDQIRERIAAVQGRLRAHLHQHAVQARQSAAFAQFCIAAGGVLATSLSGLALFLRHRDQTARRRAESEVHSHVAQLENRIADRTAEIARSNRALHALRQSGQTVIHATDESQLCAQISRIIVDMGTHRLACVCLVDPGTSTPLRIASLVIHPHQDVDPAQLLHPGEASDPNPASTALQTAQIVSIANLHKSESISPWRHTLRPLDAQSLTAIPLLIENQTAGVLLVTSKTPPASVDDETILLRTLADDLSFGLLSHRARSRQRNAEKALAESESRLRLALDASHLGSFEWNIAENRIVWSRWHEEIWGFGPGEFDGTLQCFESRVHPEDLAGMKAEIHRCLESREAYTYEYRLIRPDGTIPWVCGMGEFDYDDAGRPLHMRGVVMDITARKHIEESALRWQRIFEASQFGLACGCATTNTFLDVNEAFARERGFTRRELIGRKLVDHYPPEMQEHIRKQLEHVDQTGHAVFDAVHVRKDGSRFPVLVELTVIRDAQGKPVSRIAYALNISDRKQAEENLHQRNEELVRFIYTVSHDLKSPLVTIRTFLGYLERDLKDADQSRIDTDLGYIRKAAEKMSELLDEILELSRVGRKVSPPEEVPLQTLISEALDLVAGPIATGKVEVQITPEPLILVGDRRRLLELFQNLIDNAVKFMGDQSTPRIEIGAEDVHGKTVLFVRDNGIGIDPRHRGKLFGLFEKLHPGFPGNGIGLAIVKRIVEIHGGRIWAESEGVGHGAIFRFTLEPIRRLSTSTPPSPC